MKNSFIFMILNHPDHGHVGVSVHSDNQMVIHLPDYEKFAPFGVYRYVHGKIFSLYHKLWQVTPKVGEMIRLQNCENGETKTYQVLFVGTDERIILSKAVSEILSTYAQELTAVDKFTSTKELGGYARVIQTFFRTVVKYGVQGHNSCVARINFDSELNTSIEYLYNLNAVKLVFPTGDTVHLDVAMWYLVIYRLNQLHKDNPPFANVK